MSRSGRRALTALLLMVLIATSGCALAERVAPRAERLLRQGEKLAAEGKIGEAILTYRQALESDPNYAPALRRLGAAYEAQGRRRLAIYEYERVLALAPKDVANKLVLLRLYDALGQTAKAEVMRQTLGPQAVSATATQPAQLKTVWSAFTTESAVAGLALGGGNLYAATQAGDVYAMDPDSGAQRWHFKAGKGILSPPVYSAGPEGGLVFVGAEDGRLYALAAGTGDEVWHYQTQAPVHGSAAVGGDTVYLGSTDTTLYALRRADGQFLWQFGTQGPIHAAPLVTGDTVFFGSLDQEVYALNATTGALRWRFAAGAGVECTPTLRGERLYVGADNSRLYCLHPVSGRQLWRYSTGDAIYAPPALVGARAYVTSAGQAVFALDAEKGALAWRYDTTTFLTNAVAEDRGVLYFSANGDPKLYALDAASGSLLWSQDTGDWPETAPLLADGRMYLGERDGTVLAYQLSQ